jgi:hypothetical protein
MADGPVESGDADQIAVSVYIGPTLVRHTCIQPWSRPRSTVSQTLPCSTVLDPRWCEHANLSEPVTRGSADMLMCDTLCSHLQPKLSNRNV